jgi:hypothetical protein
VLKVILGIKAREECIRSIEELSEKDFSNASVNVGQDKIELVINPISYAYLYLYRLCKRSIT